VNNINLFLPEAIQNVCEEEECKEKKDLVCLKKLNCGHFCLGLKNEKKCMECINIECKESGQNSEGNIMH
jgi:hypothetical protein